MKQRSISLLAVAVVTLTGCSDPSPNVPHGRVQAGIEQARTTTTPAPGTAGTSDPSRTASVFTYPLYHPPRADRDPPVRNPAIPPRVIATRAPTIAPALHAGEAGIVILELIIERDGRPSGGRVLKPLPSGLTEAAIDAVRHWRFSPGRDRDGRALRSLLNVTVRFEPPKAP